MVGALVLWIFGGDYIDAAMVGYSAGGTDAAAHYQLGRHCQ